MCFYITKEFQSNPPEPVDPEVKIVKSKERIVFVKKFGGYAMQDRLDEGGREVPGRVVREKQRGGPELLLDCRLRQSHEILEQKERGRL